jgi:predicted metal-binding protein
MLEVYRPAGNVWFSVNPESIWRIIYIEQPNLSSFPLFVGKACFMAKRRGNPNWGKPEPIGPIVPTITEFEQVVREYKLTPDQYLRSTRLREWARRNKNSKYIPEPLLEAWGFEIESTL